MEEPEDAGRQVPNKMTRWSPGSWKSQECGNWCREERTPPPGRGQHFQRSCKHKGKSVPLTPNFPLFAPVLQHTIQCSTTLSRFCPLQSSTL